MNKKITFLTCLLLGTLMNYAQNPFKFSKVDYVGAMGTADWTTGWTNWSPNSTNYPAAAEMATLNAATQTNSTINISGTVNLDAAKTYLLTGIVYIKDGGVLNIPAGTTIRCEGDANATPANWSTIVVQRGGKLNINGTAANPVVFTSNKAAGSRKPGDWGGIILLGKAINNYPGGQANCTSCAKGEGVIEGPFGAPDGVHGGNSDGDNSGSITYCRVEYPGLVFGPNNEINGITLGSVGYGTKLSHIQVSFSNDDSYEWFGGAVNSTNIIAYKGTDDDFDTDNGYHGYNQFGIGMKDSSIFDPTWGATSGGSTSEGFESDNDASGTLSLPFTEAYAVGETYSQHSSTMRSAFRRGARIRRNSGQSVINTIFMGYRNGIMIDGAASEGKASFGNTLTKQDTLQVRNCIFIGMLGTQALTATGYVEVSSGRDTAKASNFLMSSYAANRINPVAWSAGTLLVDPNNYTSPNFKPVANSPALTGSSFDNTKVTNIASGASIGQSIQIFGLKIYPNPAHDFVNINLNTQTPGFANISVLSITGTTVFASSMNCTKGQNNYQLPTLSAGIYVVEIVQADMKQTVKLIVQ
jgi:hypothetical protein